ncbi:MAG: DUF1294 domain-containing protein [Oscillospiraceae bacterium]
MKQWETVAILILIVWNIFVFFLYGIDKRKAQKGQYRISEKFLITTAFFMGGLGGVCGMKIFHHKTKHTKFKILVPLALVLNLFIIAGTVYLIYIRG